MASAWAISAMCMIVLAGCAESTLIQTHPSGARVTINDRFVGVTPVVFVVPHNEFSTRSTYQYRIEREGYVPEKGYFYAEVAPGRVIGALFTLGTLRLFKPLTALRSSYDFDLRPLTDAPHKDNELPSP